MESLTLPMVIEPDSIASLQQEQNLLILDLSPLAVYHQHHVPGAIHLDYRELVHGHPPAPGELPSLDRLKTLFSRLGLHKNTHIVVYDNEGGGWAGRFIWTLDVIGHKRYSYLNGGLIAWMNEGYSVEQHSNSPKPNPQFDFQLNSHPIASKQDILNKLNHPDTVIWDARSLEEYEGSKILARKGGHIPGAIHFEWTQAMDASRNYRIVHPQRLLESLSSLGISEDKNIITHCQSHHRSGFTYLVGRYLGFHSIQAYPGSWYEWGNDPETPVEY